MADLPVPNACKGVAALSRTWHRFEGRDRCRRWSEQVSSLESHWSDAGFNSSCKAIIYRQNKRL